VIIKAATLTGISRRADRSANLRFVTMTEQTSEEMKLLDMMFQQTCLIAIKPEDSPFLDAELKDLDSVDLDLYDNNKSPSKRIRNCLYILWEQSEIDHEKEPFPEFYKIKMDKLIDMIKQKLT